MAALSFAKRRARYETTKAAVTHGAMVALGFAAGYVATPRPERVLERVIVTSAPVCPADSKPLPVARHSVPLTSPNAEAMLSGSNYNERAHHLETAARARLDAIRLREQLRK